MIARSYLAMFDDDPSPFFPRGPICCFIVRDKHFLLERTNNQPLSCAHLSYSFYLDYQPGHEQRTTDGKLRLITLTGLG